MTTVVVPPPDSLKLPVIELAEPEELSLPVVMTVYWPPPSLFAGKPGARFEVEIEHLDGRRELPIIRLRRAA
jgi:hypothetical protein